MPLIFAPSRHFIDWSVRWRLLYDEWCQQDVG